LLLVHPRAGIFDEEQARLYCAEIVAAIGHLHSLDIVHRDLKPVRERSHLREMWFQNPCPEARRPTGTCTRSTSCNALSNQ